MDVILEFLKNNLALLTTMGIVVTIIATIVGVAIHIRGDKKTKIKKERKMNKFRNSIMTQPQPGKFTDFLSDNEVNFSKKAGKTLQKADCNQGVRV